MGGTVGILTSPMYGRNGPEQRHERDTYAMQEIYGSRPQEGHVHSIREGERDYMVSFMS